MKFIAKKSQCCTMAGTICHEFETDNIEEMADFISDAYAFGSSQDSRDDDMAVIEEGNLIVTHCGVTYEPVKIESPQTIIDELLNLDWADLDVDLE